MDLLPYRSQIDALDDEIVRLFRRRMEIVEELGRRKPAAGLPLADPEREEQIIARLCGQLPESLQPGLRRLYETLFAIGKDLMSQESENPTKQSEL